MKSRRVLIISDRFYPENVAVAIRNLSFAKSLSEIGVDVSVLTGTKSKLNYNSKLIWSPLPNNKDIFIIRFLKELILGTEYFFRLLFDNNYDLVIISSPPFFSSIMASFSLILKNKKYLFDIRDDYPELFFSKGIISQKTSLGKFLLYLRNYIYKKSWAISTVTNAIYNELPSGSKSLLIKNGYDDESFQPSNNKTSAFTVVFHGSLSQFQDIHLLLKVAKRVSLIDSTIKFIVAGNGPKDYLLKNNSLSNIDFIGDVKHENIIKILQSSHLGLSFRTNDKTSKMSFPVKVYEYIGAGIPCIISPQSEAGDVIESKKMGIVFNPNNEIKISDKICELANNKSVYKFYVENVLINRRLFSRQKQLRLFINAFESEF